MPRYPFEFHQADALTFPLDGFDAAHASPPCQRHSKAVKVANRQNHPDLLGPTRRRLRASGLPYVIENVPGSPLIDAIQLCGSAFGLPIQRHRRFESNVMLMANGCAHKAYPQVYPPAWNRTTPLRVLSISGGYQKRQLGEDFMAQHKAAMGIDWDIGYDELSEAIPPAYTEWIGRQLLAALAAQQDGGERG
jgi:DNA (cytosine-5)-methyltransferase 1